MFQWGILHLLLFLAGIVSLVISVYVASILVLASCIPLGIFLRKKWIDDMINGKRDNGA